MKSPHVGITTLVAIAAGVLLSLVHVPGHATDDKRWSGALCTPYGGTKQEDYIIRGDGIQNASTTANKSVVCAITKDAEEGYSDANGHAALFVYGTRTIKGSVQCVLNKGNASFGPVVTVTRDIAPATTDWTATFDAADFSGAGATETITVVCRLPPRAKLAHILWYEDNTTNIAPL
jgi:hypothetical protein